MVNIQGQLSLLLTSEHIQHIFFRTTFWTSLWRHPTLDLRVGSVGIFFILMRVCLFPRALLLFDRNVVSGERTLSRNYRYNS